MENQEGVTPQSGTAEVSAPTVLVGKEAVAAAKKSKKDMTEAERKAAQNAAQKKSREKKAKKAEKEARTAISQTEISAKDAKAILLDERKIQNERVADTIVELAEVAARQNGLTFNKYLFTHGLRASVAAKTEVQTEVETNPPAIEADVIDGEIIHKTDLWALWDMGFWRHPEVTFEQWLADRYRLKHSAFELSKILGKEDFAETHEAWTSFVPRWNPLGLPLGYTQKQGLSWLGAQASETEGGKRRFLLVASRNSMKSTFIRIHALCLTITYPDARILVVSETNKLSKKAMKEFRGYLKMARNNPTLFQQYFSEYCIAPDEGQTLVYDNPLAHLGLPQNSVESSSMESSNTGSRFDYAIFDDPISRDNGTSNDEQKDAALAKHGSIMKLKEPLGIAVNVQTPWATEDLGDVMIKRNEEDPERPLAVRIDPVMTVKPEAAKKPLLELREEDVVLNFLPKLNWRFVRDEMRSPEGIEFFKTQYLTEWPPEEDEGLTVSFTEDEIRACIRPAGFFDVTPSNIVASLDRAFSISKAADFSVIAVGKIFQRDRKTVCGVLDVKLDRWKESVLVEQIVATIARYAPIAFVLEKDRGWENLIETVRNKLVLRGIPCPRFIAKDIPSGGKNLHSKARRVKMLELPMQDGRIFFNSSAIWNDVLIQQFVDFTIARSTATRKDDIPDAISLLYSSFMPKVMSANDEPPEQQTIDQKREAEIERRAEAARQMHERMHGGMSMPVAQKASDFNPKGPPPVVEQPRQLSPREQAMEQMMKQLPSGMRRRQF